MAKYNYIGTNYNATRSADPYIATTLGKLLSPIEGKKYLDIGCGTGNYTLALSKLGGDFTAIDPSNKMLLEARQKSSEIRWLLGSAEQLPQESNSIDGAFATLTIHHWNNLNQGFAELHRVLKPSCHLVLFTALPSQMKGYWLRHYFPKMIQDSIEQMPSLHKIQVALARSNMHIALQQAYSIKPTLRDHFLYCGKERPELYLDERIRKGISSFSSLANKEEVEIGLERLATDIDSGEIAQVIKSYKNQTGDYLFLKIQNARH